MDAQPDDLDLTTLAERPHHAASIDRLADRAWPRFMQHGNAREWGALFTTFAAQQRLLVSPDDRLAALGHAVPLRWDGTREDLPTSVADTIERALDVEREGRRPDTLAALAVIVDHDFRRRGLSSRILGALRADAAAAGLRGIIVPVRPTHKSRYPLQSMESYAAWRREDGLPADPWLRTHVRLGGEILQVLHGALSVRAPVADWERWTGMRFPESGRYIVEGALVPITIDREADEGRYEEPNVWMHHRIDGV